MNDRKKPKWETRLLSQVTPEPISNTPKYITDIPYKHHVLFLVQQILLKIFPAFVTYLFL